MRESSAATLQSFLSLATLYEVAARTPGAKKVAGRGAAFAITTSDGRWLVRHYRRGGAVARLLDDQYVRTPVPRVFRELHVSVAARAAGIPTPEVVAAVVYANGAFVRYDIAVVFIPAAFDLAAVLFDDVLPDVDAETRKAANVIHTACERGLVHADLNLKNILLAPDRGYIVDLDRCRMSQPSRAASAAMRSRFLRSLQKWQKRTGKTVAPAHRQLLEDAFRAD